MYEEDIFVSIIKLGIYSYQTSKHAYNPGTSKNVGGIFQYELINYGVGYDKDITFVYHELKGNVLQCVTKNGNVVCYKWDNLETSQISKIVKEKYANSATTSFEDNGNGDCMINSPSRNSLQKLTGSLSYNVPSAKVVKSGLLTAQVYVLSFWFWSFVTTVTVGAPAAGQVENGRTYYEKFFTSNTSVIQKTWGIINELPLHSQGALMTTYRYLFGSEIIKKHEYNFQVR